MPLLPGKSKKAFSKNVETEMDNGKPQKQSLAIAYSMKKKRKKMAEGGKVGGASTSTTGNKTKTGGSNPGGASTGGAGTVTITTGKNPPQSISVSDVGGNTRARNAGGMDPSDKDDKMMMSKGGDMKSRRERMMDAALGRKMADGGEMVGSSGGPEMDHASGYQSHADDQAILNEAARIEDRRALNQHGQIEEGQQTGGDGFHDESYMGNQGNSHDEYSDTEDSGDMVGRIMKQRQQSFSEGGRVANQDKEITGDMPNEFDDLHLRDDLEFSETGANSGDELGNDREDHDRKDIVARIMRSRAKKDRNPNPA